MTRPGTLFRVVCEKGHVSYHTIAPWIEKDLCAVGKNFICLAPLVKLDSYECASPSTEEEA